MISCLLATSLLVADQMHSEADDSNMCGPLAVVSVCELLGNEVSLEEVLRDCEWDGSPIAFAKLSTVLRRYDVDTTQLVCSREDLMHRLQVGYLAILAVPVGTNDSEHHAIVVYQSSDHELVVIDRGITAIDKERHVLSHWDGDAILVSNQHRQNMFMWLIPVTGLVIALLLTKKWNTNK